MASAHAKARVVWLSVCKSIMGVQRKFLRVYQKAAPDAKRIKARHKFLETGRNLKGHGGGRQRVSDEKVENVRTAFIRCPTKSVRRAARELQMPRVTVHTVLRKLLCLLQGADSAVAETRGQPTATQFFL
jgi:hypothetical protein